MKYIGQTRLHISIKNRTPDIFKRSASAFFLLPTPGDV